MDSVSDLRLTEIAHDLDNFYREEIKSMAAELLEFRGIKVRNSGPWELENLPSEKPKCDYPACFCAIRCHEGAIGY